MVFRKHALVKGGSRLRSAMRGCTALTPTLSLPWGSSPLICCAQVKSHNMILYDGVSKTQFVKTIGDC